MLKPKKLYLNVLLNTVIKLVFLINIAVEQHTDKQQMRIYHKTDAFYNMDCIKPFRVQKQADGLQAPACCLLAMLLATVLVIDSLSHRLYQVAKGE